MTPITFIAPSTMSQSMYGGTSWRILVMPPTIAWQPTVQNWCDAEQPHIQLVLATVGELPFAGARNGHRAEDAPRLLRHQHLFSGGTQPDANGIDVELVQLGVANGRQDAPEIRVGREEGGLDQGGMSDSVADALALFAATAPFNSNRDELACALAIADDGLRKFKCDSTERLAQLIETGR